MIILPYGFQNQRTILCEIIRDIEKDISELNYQKNVLKTAFNSLKDESDCIKDNKSMTNIEVAKILENKQLNR